MKVLWITNILFPEATAVLTGNKELRSSGGWMLGAAENLLSRSDIELYVATVSPFVSQLQRIEGKQIVYYVIPFCGSTPKSIYEEYWLQVRSSVCPDVVHIHGTECFYGYSYIKACGSHNVVISIQGMLSGYYPYYCSGMSFKNIICNLTIRDLIKGTILKGKRDFRRNSKYEIVMLNSSSHVIGRTSWDRAKTWAINPNAQYHFCNETLRSEFYDDSLWNYDNCYKHSIFISQAGYPIKGLHQLLKAMPLILRDYPDTIIKVAGHDITKKTKLRDYLSLTGYGKYIKRLIKKLSLEDKVFFTGNLNAQGMKSEYLTSNIFVCPSSIENSPNSLAEAQILGVPCVSAYVGGTMDMMIGCEANMYRFEEVEMLAYKICQTFSKYDSPDIVQVSNIKKRHDPIENANTLYNIYTIINNE